MRRRILLAAGGFVLGYATLLAAQVPASLSGPARDLPSPVLHAFRASYPNATITDAAQEREDGKIAFRVSAEDKGRHRVIVYDLTGTVLEAAEQVDEKDLPAPVAGAIHAQAKATYVRGMKVTRGASVQYEVTLRGSRKTTMILKPDGTVVSSK